MNWVTSTSLNLRSKRLTKFLLIFSFCSLAIAGMVWACAFEDENSFSAFSPEAFVAKEYTPFFYDTQNWYYGKNVETADNNDRFNNLVIDEWDGYLDHQFTKPTLRYLLLHSSKVQIDSVDDYLNGKISILKPDSIKINMDKADHNKINNFFNYLRLAKECEKFAVSEDRGWYDDPKPPPTVSLSLENALISTLNSSKDKFIKQRLWFQLERYYFFYDDTAKRKQKPINDKAKILTLFDKYSNEFPKNLTYYRTLGYVAGYYRQMGHFAQANYLYSRCYDFSFEMKIPSKFSFHAQQDEDWQETLKLAKNKEEKITLWHMIGMEYDGIRAIKEIAALDPKSDKVDLLLSRLINSWESADTYSANVGFRNETVKRSFNYEVRIIDSIASKNNSGKSYYWNIAAGYLHYMNKDYSKAGTFYAIAKRQLPTNDVLITGQYKLLTTWLAITTLHHIDAKTEIRLVEPLTWLKDLETTNDKPGNLRFAFALRICSNMIADIYIKQGDTLKAECFNNTSINYANKAWVQKLVELVRKPDKSPFEKVMLRYYPHTLDELYCHQGTSLVYEEKIDSAILILNKISGKNATYLPANPFNGRLNDCHDCDQAAPQKRRFTQLTFLKTIRSIKAGLTAGKNRYRNALLLANAYYNISYYGNNRQFYEFDIFSGIDILSQKISEK